MSGTYVALLRGINVGGNKKVPMADLRTWLADVGYGDVQTYIQSGNAVFTAPVKSAARVQAAVEAAIKEHSGFAVDVMVRTRAQLERVIADNPYPEADDEPTKVHVAFLTAKPDLRRVRALDITSFAPDELTVGDGVLYLRLPDGMGRSKLAVELAKPKLGVAMTVRNWRTVRTLLEMAGA